MRKTNIPANERKQKIKHFSKLLVQIKIVELFSKIIWQHLSKLLIMCILFDPRIPPVEISSKEIVGLKFKANHTRMFIAALFNYLKTGNNKCTPLGDQISYGTFI